MNDDRSLEPTLIRAVWQYRVLVAFFVVVFAAGAFLFARATDSSEYEAIAGAQVADPQASVIFGQVTQRFTDFVEGQAEIMRSGPVLQDAVSSLRDENPLWPYDITQYLERLRVQVGESAVIIITFRADTELNAIEGANQLIISYEEFVQSATRRGFESTVAVLRDTIDQLELDLTAIDVQIEDAREADPAIRQLRESFDRLTEDLVDLFARAADTPFDQQSAIQAELRTVQAQLGVLQDVFAIQDSERLGDLFAERDRIQSRLDDLTERRDQIVVDIELLADPVQVSSPAITGDPVPSNVGRLVLVGIFLGGLIGAGVAYVLALRRRTFVDRMQPELILDAPLIAAVPNFRQEGIRTSLPVRDAPHSVSAEAFRFAAGALDLSRATPTGTVVTQGKVVAISSADVAEGKTVAASNIALAAARVGKRVLLIDGDFGNQVATELLSGGQRAAAGITEVVESGVALSKAVIPVEGTGSTGLHLLARGWSSTTAPEFFRLPATREFLEQVQDYYDLVLVDAPPVLHVAYASVLLGLVDRVLVVVRHESSASDLEEYQDRLDLIGTPTVGYIYNLTPLRTDLSRGQGSARDVLGKAEPPQGGFPRPA